MWLRPWHVIACVVVLAGTMIGFAYEANNDRAKDVLLGVGVNLLSSVVFFVLLETYWQRMKRANGKEVDGFDYAKFARNVTRSRYVRILGTYIYPFTHHPAHLTDRIAVLSALRDTARRSSFTGAQFLFLSPSSSAAQARAAERKDDDVLTRMAEAVATLNDLLKELDGHPARHRVEVRLFTRTPPFALFQMDNFASISFYFRDRPISEVTRYEFFMDSPIGGFVEKTFDDLWHDPQTVTLEAFLAEREQDQRK